MMNTIIAEVLLIYAKAFCKMKFIAVSGQLKADGREILFGVETLKSSEDTNKKIKQTAGLTFKKATAIAFQEKQKLIFSQLSTK